MTISDLHPEDLLDKEARGQLSERERTLLNAHLERCAVCRFQREVRADFDLDLSDEDTPSMQGLLALTEQLGAAAKKEPEKASEPEAHVEAERVVPLRTRRPQRTVRILLLAAAALLVAGVATAGGGVQLWTRISAALSPGQEAEIGLRDSSDRETPAKAPVAAKAPAKPIEAPVPTPVAEPEPAPTPEPAPVAIAPAPVAPPSGTTKREVASASAPQVDSATAIFDAANEARRSGDHARALELHRQLESTYPKSREAHASQAIVGRLLLDRGDAAGALVRFDAYLAQGSGPLDETARVGRALAFERLHRADEARAAWQAVLTAFPETPWAEHARTRLAAEDR